MSDAQLLGVPMPFDFEPLSAWLPRLALSQGSALPEVAKFLGIDLRRDVDRVVIGDELSRVRRTCVLAQSAFAVSEQIMQSLDLMKPVGDQFMAKRMSGRSRFRFCACCLSEMATPHFPIHWRFIAWRWCPLHDCLLEDTCPHCSAPVLLPTCIQSSASGRAGYGGLDRCQSCTKRLTNVAPCRLQVDSVRLVNQWEDQQLANGRALLAALVRRSYRIEGRSATYRLRSLAELKRTRAFPQRFDWLTPNQLRRRIAKSPSAAVGQVLLSEEHDPHRGS